MFVDFLVRVSPLYRTGCQQMTLVSLITLLRPAHEVIIFIVVTTTTRMEETKRWRLWSAIEWTGDAFATRAIPLRMTLRNCFLHVCDPGILQGTSDAPCNQVQEST